MLLGNGCQEIMDDEAWAKLKALPINVQHETGAASNFDLLIEGRAPCQMVDPATIERQRRFSRDICGNE